MIYFLYDVIVKNCCFGKAKPVKRVEQLKQEIQCLSEQELNHIKAFLVRGIKNSQCCC